MSEYTIKYNGNVKIPTLPYGSKEAWVAVEVTKDTPEMLTAEETDYIDDTLAMIAGRVESGMAIAESWMWKNITMGVSYEDAIEVLEYGQEITKGRKPSQLPKIVRRGLEERMQDDYKKGRRE